MMSFIMVSIKSIGSWGRLDYGILAGITSY